MIAAFLMGMVVQHLVWALLPAEAPGWAKVLFLSVAAATLFWVSRDRGWAKEAAARAHTRLRHLCGVVKDDVRAELLPAALTIAVLVGEAQTLLEIRNRTR